MKQLIFVPLLIGSFAVFGWSVSRLARFLMRSQPERKEFPRFDRWPRRLVDVLVYFVFQKKVGESVSYDAASKGITSKHHLIIFWGFLIIQVGALEMWLGGIHEGWNLSFIGAPLYHGVKLIIDWFNVLVLMMIVYAYFRRIVLKPRLIPINLDASLILFFIGFLMVTHFAHHAFHFSAVGHVEDYGVGSFSAILYGLLPEHAEWAASASEAAWWLHVITIFTFLNYIPYSKHIHLLGSLPNIAFRNLDARILGTKRDLENESDWGVGKIEQFTWKQLLDGYACTECARCSNFCPAFNTDKPLSPFAIIQDMKHEMLERGALELKISKLQKQLPAPVASTTGAPEVATTTAAASGGLTVPTFQDQIDALRKQLDEMEPLVGGRIKDEALWACTTCGACQEVCPVFIEHPRAIVDMRTHLTLVESRMPAELGRMFTNLERNSNPWGISADKRMDWTSDLAEGITVPTIEDNPTAEYLLFVGCAGSFDDRIKKSMRALVQCLHAAKVSFAVLGPEEQCSGDPARRGGNEYLFQMQAQANVDAMNAAKVTKVVASCPHCFQTIKNEYPQFGGKYEVLHHSQLLAHLIAEKKLAPTANLDEKMAYHDSCYLGRWNGEYKAPRKVLSVLSNSPLVELGRKEEHGFCCGGGGARMFMEEKIGTRVNRNRSDEIIATGVKVAAVACPFCTIMISDGVKDAGANVEVLDIAEVLARSLDKQSGKHALPAASAGATPSDGAPSS